MVAWAIAFALGGMAIIFPTIMGLLQDELAPHERGVGTGFFMVFSTIATGVGMPLTGLVGGIIGIQVGIQLAAILPGIAFVLMLLIHPRPGAGTLGKKTKLYLIIMSVVIMALSIPYIMMLR